MMMMSSPIPPPPYQPTTVASGPNHNNSSSSSASVDMKQLKKALANFRDYNSALIFCIVCAALHLYLSLLIISAMGKFGEPVWTLVFWTAILCVPCPLAINALIKQRPVRFLPFILIQMGGGFLFSCFAVCLVVNEALNQTKRWVEQNNGGGIIAFYSMLLILNLLSQCHFWNALQGMIRYPASIHKMALSLRMFFTCDVASDPALVAEMLEWLKRMKH